MMRQSNLLPTDASATRTQILYGWTFHQSHDQATVLFLVPQWVSAKDLDIQIETEHIVAAVRDHPPIIKAKLYGRVNSDASTWRIADRDKARSKRRSRSLTRSSQTTSSNEASVSDSKTSINPARDTSQPQYTSSSGTASPDLVLGRLVHANVPVESPPPSHSSLSASVTSLRSGSSYEVVPSSSQHRSQFATAASATGWSSGSSDFGSSDSADANLAHSTVLSEPDQAQHRHSSANAEAEAEMPLRRSRSTADVPLDRSNNVPTGNQHPSLSRGLPPPSNQGPPEVRLVTLHLEKIDSGIWPVLVVGPAPLRIKMLPPRLRMALHSDLPSDAELSETYIAEHIHDARRQRQSRRQRTSAQRQLNQALEEALSNFEGGDRMLASIRRGIAGGQPLHAHAGHSESDDDYGPNASNISINTIGSDESATVLGTTVASLSGTSASFAQGLASASWIDGDETDDDEEEAEIFRELETEAKFNMDPTTLSLIGLQIANRRSLPFTSGVLRTLVAAPSSGIPEAFEHFARAWRAAEIGLATERLVHDYLPLLPTQSSDRDERLPDLIPEEQVRDLSATIEVITAALRDCLENSAYLAQRQRLIASLGGPKALARLYVSYGRLRLPSQVENRSPLAFPYGQLTSPFVSGRDASLHKQGGLHRKSSLNKATSVSSQGSSAASSRGAGLSGAKARSGEASSPSKGTNAPNSPIRGNFSESASPHSSPPIENPGGTAEFSDFFMGHEQSIQAQPGPFYFFQEACLLDEEIRAHISGQEWLEAVHIALEDERLRQEEMEGLAEAEEMGSLAGDSENGCLVFDSDTDGRSTRVQRRCRPPLHSPSQLRPSLSSGRGLSGLFSLGRTAKSDSDEDSTRKRSGKPSKRPDSKKKRRKERRTSRSLEAEADAGMLNFVSGAALLGVALAGSVAALGWWRRTSGAIRSSA